MTPCYKWSPNFHFIEKGFDFLGYHFSPEGLSVAKNTIERFIARAIRLYEQEREEPCGSPLLGLYAKRWVRWLYGGIAPRAFDVAVHSVLAGYPRPNEYHARGPTLSVEQ